MAAPAFHFPEISTLETMARLGSAAALSALIGLEREFNERSAGLRTHILVGVASCAITIVSAYGFAEFFSDAKLPAGSPAPLRDPTRIAAQIVSGIGFLGGGVILRSGLNVRGLTTAASLWAVSGVGMATGAGMYALGGLLTAVLLFSLVILRRVNDVIYEHYHHDDARITVRLTSDDHLDRLLAKLKEHAEDMGSFSAESLNDRDEELVTINVTLQPGRSRIELAREVKKLRGVIEVHVSDGGSGR